MELGVEVRDITVDRANGVVIVFGDGTVGRFDLEELRVHCPCAGCRGAREQGRVPWPEASSPRPLTISDAHLTGAWGLSITWNDGHNTGIYPFASLHRWATAGAPPRTPDSGLRA
jgi:DUF971 family protein